MTRRVPTDIPGLVEAIRGMKRGGRFTPYIDFIEFPRYRSINPRERINFSFPLTVLVGRNGTGKSSVLQALYGAPYGQSVADYWFGTAVDPVEQGEMEEVETVDDRGRKKRLREEQKAAFWYGYKEGGTDRQAIKQRVRRERGEAFEDHENWEPTRPNLSFGMAAIPREHGRRVRDPQIEMNVEYLNLRYLLSAFDRCFNFLSESSIGKLRNSKRWEVTRGRVKPKIQDYIRSRAQYLNDAFGSDSPYLINVAEVSEAPELLSNSQLTLVSRIVGKDYQEGVLLRHRIYDNAWAYSIKFRTRDGQYSEANAGSGETSVVQIVRLFETAGNNSLLLLDEPETSLHPGAQRELLKYILGQIYSKNLQVVLSTHAPSLVYELPRDAIKVMRRRADGRVIVEEGLSAEEAFYEIGHPFDPTCNVIVEDKLAKLILEGVAKAKGDGFAAKLRVEFRPGGETGMKKDIALFMNSGHRPVFVFDGDCRTAHVDPELLPMNQQTDEGLDPVILVQTGVAVTFHQDSNMSARQKGELRAAYLRYYLSRVFYLPFLTPEEGVWNGDVARLLLNAIIPDAQRVADAMTAITAEEDHKAKFRILAEVLGQGADHPSSSHAMFVTHFISRGGSEFIAVSDLLDQVVAAAEHEDA